MNRLGFRHDNLARTLPEIARSEHLAIDAVYTHFATADEPEHPAFDRAARAVRPGRSPRCRRSASTPPVRHAANSAALLRDERVWYDFVRPGLLLYGIVPPPLAAHAAAATCPVTHSRIVHVKGMRPGEGTGYGLQSVVDRAADDRDRAGGLRRRPRPPDGRRALHAGTRKTRTRRRIGVHGHDHDRCHRPGRAHGRRSRHRRRSRASEEIGVREIAASIGTIPYELLCRVGTRIERLYTRFCNRRDQEIRRSGPFCRSFFETIS